MLSYHRVLAAFGRSVNDKTLECNCDVHPWEITVNGENWPGKIRLIGFVDVFFVIAYSANDCFMKGVIIYKDPKALGLLDGLRVPEPAKSDAGNDKLWDEYGYYYDSSDSGFDTDSDEDRDENTEGSMKGKHQKQQNRRVKFQARSVYTASSLGHEISLKATFSTSSIQTYTVKVDRPASWAMSRRMKRALKTHGVFRLVQDALRAGIITHGQMMGHVTGLLFTGGRFTDTVSRAFQATSGDSAQRHTLSNDNI
ncbi:uncharacterized protein BDW47DRAFT_97349 [Aspergillus candidus]|uniref:Uncharacterized protein n=1 Tax=Aspergillus candidus TaxID=41067 RepID=A0A2I2FPG3_ASPCN|nr:hypothetical protein BDW47DRAFT_97349 [Aspergillus candidus]PLB42527.1 hypothetical protein BDW47DRAFT_97349 [Aspergillus candidus]